VAASRELDLSAPAVTRSVSRLEKSLGVKLFNRTTRLVRLTEAGQRYAADVREILERIDQADALASGSTVEPKGILSVTAPELFGYHFIMPIVTEYLDTYPDVSVRAVFFDRIGYLLEEGIDVAVRIGHLEDSTLYAVHVGSICRVVCGSPTYFKKHGTPESPDELAKHSIVQATAVEPSTTWVFGGKQKSKVQVFPRLQCSQNNAAIRAAEVGTGITRVMSYQVGEELKNGTLKRVLADFEPDPLPLNIVYVEGRQANAKIRAFVKMAAEHLRKDHTINS
jgi:DNA-binding transcriptional LysR family regulator